MGKYKKPKKRRGNQKKRDPQVTGIVRMAREGYAFVQHDSADNELFIPARKLRGALNGDRVRVAVLGKRGGERLEGQVVAIEERSKRPYVGIVHTAGADAWVLTESRFMPYDISIPLNDNVKKWQGKKVAALVTDWPRASAEPVGRIVDILGEPGENDTEMHAILAEFGLPYKFERKVEAAAKKLSRKINEEDLKEREDFRKVTTFTVDPTDAKDFDDALSIRELSENRWEVAIHIADVTHYVKPGTVIDKEALNRGTSVYLADRTVPMLPPTLSNELCSLRPNEDKLCFSAIFDLDENAKVLKQRFVKTVIRSDHRLDYGEVQQMIDEQNGEGVGEAVLKLHQLALKLREERVARGAISFERPDMRVIVDKQGKPIDIIQEEPTEAHWLIEEFMLLANRRVAHLIGTRKGGRKKAPTFVYRVHEEPSFDKVESFLSFVKHYGYKVQKVKQAREFSKMLNSLLANLKGKPESGALEIMALRSMARAKYTTDNKGHYGLAFDFYTHFTSPIRRYPDMMVHRMLVHYLTNGKSLDKKRYEEMAQHSSEREQLAVEAERASVKYKMVEFMQDKIGEEFKGNVSGVTEWGLYVEIEGSKIEGMVSVREVKEDFFYYDADSMSLKGRRSKKVFTLGTPVKIKVAKANLALKQLDFQLIWED